MTHSDLIAVLRSHPNCCKRFRWNVRPAYATTHDGETIAVAGTRGDIGPHPLGHVVGPLVLWCWEHGIEAIHHDGTWQAIGDGTKSLSGVHAEPWLALLQACEGHEEVEAA